jgi:hypothetical protein
LNKGMGAAGFFPPLAVMTLHALYSKKRISHVALSTAVHVLGLVAVLALYLFAVKHSSTPDYVKIYFDRQLANRIGPQFNLMGLFDGYLWGRVFAFLYPIWPLVFVAFFQSPKEKGRALAMSAFLTFLVLIASAGMTARHHYILLMPWAAWLLGLILAKVLPWKTENWVKASGVFAVTLVVIAQYIPVSVHGNKPTLAQLEVGRLKKGGLIAEMIRDVPEAPKNFLDSSVYAWYGDVKVSMPDDGKAKSQAAYYLHQSGYEKRDELKRKGWCLHAGYFDGEIWLHCDVIARARIYN